MLRFKILCLTVVMTVAHFALLADQAQGGPLLDWLRGRRCRRATVPFLSGQTAVAPASTCGLQPGQCMTTCQQTCSRVVVNYVPCTAYRTCYKRVPVTTYRPVTTSDPCTGCTVTCMKPCTTYTYQLQRVPYTTYRPVYRTETYKVPVTYITNGCSTGTCNTCPTGSCSTCPMPGAPAVGGTSCPTCSVPGNVAAPAGTLSTGGTYAPAISTPSTATPTPADVPPTLNVNPQTQQRPAYDRIEIEGSSTRTWPATPTIRDSYTGQSSQSTTQPEPRAVPLDTMARHDPVRRRWTYSPIRQAAYTSIGTNELAQRSDAIASSPTNEGTDSLSVVRGQWSDAEPGSGKANAAWKTIDW